MKYYIYRINKKTRIPFKIEEGSNINKCTESILKLGSILEYNYAIRIENE